ncbi:Glu-tRNA(Gln) amidotransferase subunit GatD [Fervidicoccus fontis]|uniref:Glutamyl-tRNA(Gln) amidotransferase subunit D n=2 Tax=Fervidicoccus fontis TaxID=683846 RepID=I0A2J6_FERFK|nr:Glu-tRNA(Gln) amidotransferase subunit GatD [Fervidicoccus fontis]AFH43203.1 glutamyl-tRNA(Gln) amidotransferase subunit D [Fervidicoccus fontis Kam940]MBE9390583.1 Glu-tRNA(Gln) amidotransferase subunit GatD [Fervidicoccus fontis]PMB75925.1 MAG: Glu-tRNA(Gln) amidotransferase GatDE subunit D [Fervidicoccus fontis]PMB77414.1 MAG: Glu-tRNA(Gln) amidotransferase GatDE subunit D [Fervidicoccus fontis]HEW63904.1 Glu-tRNA(Gln) amidotransferase subunit GatD [Fervidicoccus fontis]
MSEENKLLSPGIYVRIKTKDGAIIEGLIVQRYEIFDPGFITLKLKNGYNIGISIKKIESVELLNKEIEMRRGEGEIVPIFEKTESKGKEIHIISTGGTIASKIDYQTGGVKPVLTADELIEMIPELNSIAKFKSEILMSIFSENMNPKYWEKIAERVAEVLVKEPDTGVIITHGTDTLAYTSSALSFALRNIGSPIALVGSQRSSDRPSSDSPFNLIAASIYATSDICEPAVVMHGETSDSYALAHRGTRVRKMHTSRRDAFQSISSLPLAKIFPAEKKIEVIRKDAKICSKSGNLEAYTKFSENVSLLKYYPGMPGWIFEILAEKGIKGIVIEGSGLGHVSTEIIDSIKNVIDRGTIVVMTSQCIFGRVNMNVYSTGRLLKKIGIISGENMLSETAFVKLSWLLGNFKDEEEITRLFATNIAGEYEGRELLNYYPRWNHGEQ